MKTSKITPELRDRAVRMVLEHCADHSSQWATIESIAPKIGFTPQALVIWIQRTEIDQGPREGVTTAERERVTAFEREVLKLRRANEVLS
jgi:transposase-like protein